MTKTRALIEKLNREKQLEQEEWIFLLENSDSEDAEFLFSLARKIAKQQFGNRIYTRGLIEFTNYCRNNCFYCGIRRDKLTVFRYLIKK